MISHPLSCMFTATLRPLPWAFGYQSLAMGFLETRQLIRSLSNKRHPSSISTPSVSVQPSSMQSLASHQTSVLLCSQTPLILSHSSIHSQHYLHSTGCWFWLLTLPSVKASIFECSMCLETTIRLLMLSLSCLENDQLTSSRPECVISTFQPPQVTLGAARLWASCHPLRPSNLLGLPGPWGAALNSYLTFCQLHHLDPDPTVNTLSLYITFMSHHIEPRSVRSYLAGIVCELEPSYPSVRQNPFSPLVVRTLKGSMRRFSNPVQQKSPLTRDDLRHVFNHLPRPLTHDNLLFLTMLFGLLRLGELVQPDTCSVRSAAKTSWRHDVCLDSTSFSFIILQSKTDAMFEGDQVVIQKSTTAPDPSAVFRKYLRSVTCVLSSLYWGPFHACWWRYIPGCCRCPSVPNSSDRAMEIRHLWVLYLSSSNIAAGCTVPWSVHPWAPIC